MASCGISLPCIQKLMPDHVPDWSVNVSVHSCRHSLQFSLGTAACGYLMTSALATCVSPAASRPNLAAYFTTILTLLMQSANIVHDAMNSECIELL